MLQSLIRWVIPLVALLGLGPAAGFMTVSLRAPDGGRETSLLLCESPGRGVLAGVVAMALALVAGVLGAWAIGRRTGLFCAGLVLVWAAWGTGRADALLRRTLEEGSLSTLALEGLLVGAMAVGVAFVILRVRTRPEASAEARDPEHQHHHLPDEPAALWDSTAPVALLAAIILTAVITWLLAQETLKGQTIAAAAFGALAGAAALRVVSQRAIGAWAFVGVGVLMAASPLAAGLIHRGDTAVQAALAGNLFHLARPLPLDWAAGAFLGVPLGLSWAIGMVEKHQPAPARR